MRIEPRISLTFNGDCDAAFALYAQCFGATVTFRLTWGDSPMADQAPADRIFTQFAHGGLVTVPLQQTFWARRFGEVVDRFGIPWAINGGEREV